MKSHLYRRILSITGLWLVYFSFATNESLVDATCEATAIASERISSIFFPSALRSSNVLTFQRGGEFIGIEVVLECTAILTMIVGWTVLLVHSLSMRCIVASWLFVLLASLVVNQVRMLSIIAFYMQSDTVGDFAHDWLWPGLHGSMLAFWWWYCRRKAL